MGVPTSQVSYTSATTGRGDHEVHKGPVVALEEKKYSEISLNSQSMVERELFAGGVSCTLFAVFVYFKSVSLFYLKRINLMMS
jgi:hypothetical protein